MIELLLAWLALTAIAVVLLVLVIVAQHLVHQAGRVLSVLKEH